jgi:predicted metal-dependent phosphoesterase TrpH
MLREIRVDLHIHSCLSPCGDASMIPARVVSRAKEEDLHGIGICDHNSAENVEAVMRAGSREGLAILGGMEIASREEIHILAFFDKVETLAAAQEIVYRNLDGENNAAAFGEQHIVDELGHIMGSNPRLLIGATSLSVNEVVNMIHELGGIAIASHIDRPSFSVVSQLGFIPEDLRLDAVEVSPRNAADSLEVRDLPVVSFSDAHCLDDVGLSFTVFRVEELSAAEIGRALRNEAGRRVA